MYVIILVITSLPPKRPEESRSIYLSLKFYQNCNTKSLCVCVCVCVVCLDVCMCVQSVCMYVCAVCVQIWCAKNCARLFRYLGLKGELCYFSHHLSLSLSPPLSLSLFLFYLSHSDNFKGKARYSENNFARKNYLLEPVCLPPLPSSKLDGNLLRTHMRLN